MSSAATNPTSVTSVPSMPEGNTAQAPGPAGAGLQDLYRLNVDEYERIGGMLDDDRVELIDGYLAKKMSKRPPHIRVVKRTFKLLLLMLPAGWTWQKEDPIRIPDFNEPEPDITILRGTDADYDNRIPEPADVGLLIEVSETTLDRDQGAKLMAYARCGIPIYWIINLVDGRVEVYSEPEARGYRTRQEYVAGQDVPVVVGGTEIGRIAVSTILA